MKTVLFITLIAVLILLQSVRAIDYSNDSIEPLFDFPINLTILETIGTYFNPSTNDSGNFTHYWIGFEIYLENHSITIENVSDPDLGNWTYTYDLAGNLIRQKQQGGGNLITGDGYYREYDALNQLIRIRNGSTASSPIIENYTYDPFGQRVKIERNDFASTKIYTPFKELMRIVNSSGTYDFTYVYQDGVLVARVNPDGTKYYYHPDHLGSTTLITDQNGSVVENTFYSPYGEILSGGTADVKLYTGQFADITNQYYYGARYYKPSSGQFVQADTEIQKVYNPQSLNHYSYVWNNPYKYNDPTGRHIGLLSNEELEEYKSHYDSDPYTYTERELFWMGKEYEKYGPPQDYRPAEDKPKWWEFWKWWEK